MTKVLNSKRIIAILLVFIVSSSMLVFAGSAPTIKAKYSKKTVYSAKKQYAQGSISVASGQRIVLYDANGKAISLQRMPNNGLTANFKLPMPQLKKGQNVFVVRSETIGDVPASNALTIVYTLKSRPKSTKSSDSSTTSVSKGGVSQSTKDVIDGACAWAVAIAADNSFHYGACNKSHGGLAGIKPKVNNNHTMCSHHNGCYFCKTNRNKDFKWIVDKDKTFCCNPFVHAAFAHGGGEPEMLKICKSGMSYGFAKGEGYDTSDLFKKMGKIKVSKLKKGDVLCTGSHAMLYIGDGKIAQAGGRDDNKKGSKAWNNSIEVTTVKSSDYERVYRYIGNGGGTMEVVK